MVAIVILITVYLSIVGFSYYNTAFEERFYHPSHDWFKPSGPFGHGLGIIGTLMMAFGVGIYIARKRYNFLARLVRLKYMLEFHIFLCTLGPILVLFHTAFKFGGIVSIAFWSMVAVVLSGVIGRFIYVQIPRTVEGKELSRQEVEAMKRDLQGLLMGQFRLGQSLTDDVVSYAVYGIGGQAVKPLGGLAKALKSSQVSHENRNAILQIVKEERALAKKIIRLQRMKNLFKYWHVAHMPFAIIMLVIVVLHIGITLAFGYKWIF